MCVMMCVVQGTAHRIDEYLRCLLRRHRTRVCEQAEKYHLEQILHRRQASSAMLAWADKRYVHNCFLRLRLPII